MRKGIHIITPNKKLNRQGGQRCCCLSACVLDTPQQHPGWRLAQHAHPPPQHTALLPLSVCLVSLCPSRCRCAPFHCTPPAAILSRCSGPLQRYLELKQHQRESYIHYFYETTVGAGELCVPDVGQQQWF